MKRLNRAVVSVLWAILVLVGMQACAATGETRSSTIEVHLVEPAYRDSLFSTQTNAVIRVSVRSAQAAEAAKAIPVVATLTSTGDDEELREAKAVLDAGEEKEIVIPAARLAPGEYKLSVGVVDHAGKTSNVFERKVTQWPPAKGREVWLDADGNLRVNGELYFAHGFFSMRPKHFPVSAPAGINSGIAWFMRSLLSESDQAVKEYLDAAHANGVSILGYPYPMELKFILQPLPGRNKLTDKEREMLGRVIRKWKDHPAIIGWYLFDEPDLKNKFKTPRLTRDVYELVRAEDPYHPCVTVVLDARVMKDYKVGGDIVGGDPYPSFLPEGCRRPTRIRNELRELAHAGKPMWTLLQAYSQATIYGPDHPTWGNDRAPSYSDVRMQAYQALVNDSRGIYWYAFETGKRLAGEHAKGTWGGGGSCLFYEYEELSHGVYYGLAPEMQRMGKLLLAAKRGPMLNVAAAADVEACLFERPEGQIVVGLNMTNEPQKGVRVSLPKAEGTAWHVVMEGRQVTEREGALVDDFQPYTVHVYSTAVLDQGLPTMGEIAQKFKEGRRAPQPKP